MKNKFYFTLIFLYTGLLCYLSFIACFFAYQKEHEDLLSKMDTTANQLSQEYQSIIGSFWQMYLSLSEKNTDSYTVFKDYFTIINPHPITPWEQLIITRTLSRIMLLNNRIKWIGIYSPARTKNYILFYSDNSLLELDSSFPYFNDLKNRKDRLEIYTPRRVRQDIPPAFTVCGSNSPAESSECIIVGYSTEDMERICENSPPVLKSLEFTVMAGNTRVFDWRRTDSATDLKGKSKVYSDSSFYHSKMVDGNVSTVSYQVLKGEFSRRSHRNTPLILLSVTGIATLSAAVYLAMIAAISREVAVIRKGLVQIGENNLSYRLPEDLKHNSLAEISVSINTMTKRLSENINRAYYFELMQKDTELAELQAKFNPHFLYNTLEMLRSRSYQNGDMDTASLITELAGIFRGFINAKVFIPIAEELAFSKRYLALFSARYGDSVKVRFNVDTEVLQYGVIRNVFQPLIENYFIHGFDTSGKDNYILFRGYTTNTGKLILSVEDNGTGMTDSEIRNLKYNLNHVVESGKESYGLKNLNKRLALFYGSGCGLDIHRNGEKGLVVEMKILKMTCEEYEKQHSRSINDLNSI